MYAEQKVHVPKMFHKKIKAALKQDQLEKLTVHLDLIKKGDATVLMTPAQIAQMRKAVSLGKTRMTIRMSKKQVLTSR